MKWVKFLACFVQLGLITSLGYALPFSITPVGTLPTTYPAVATYDVQNTTQRALTGNLVKYLPPNVEVLPSAGATACTPSSGFTLAAGASCQLQLNVSGKVNRHAPNPRHHLMICAKDKVSCAGPIPLYSINVQTTLKAIAVFPKDATIPEGTSKQYKAIGHYSDGSVVDLTTLVQWTSSNTNTATIGLTTGLATGVAASTTPVTITAAYGAVSGTATLTVDNPTLRGITITPLSWTLPVNYSKQYTAIGHYDNGRTADITTLVSWHSNNHLAATIGANTGIATGVDQGSATISATYQGVPSNNATLTVVAGTLNSITVTPYTVNTPAGFTVQYTATGHFSGGTTEDLTTLSTWTSSNLSVATIITGGASSGLATALREGSTSITAVSGGKTSNAATMRVTSATLSSITVTPATQSIPAGFTQQYTATGTYSDGTSVDITKRVTWASSNEAVATIDDLGLATGVVAGSTSITASLDGITNSPAATLTITSATLVSIAVGPHKAFIPVGLTQQYVAIGTYSDHSTKDITSSVTWNSSNLTVASIDSTGLAVGLGVGSTTINATYSTIQSNEATLTVTTATLTSISITPTTASIPVGLTQQYTAYGTYSNGLIVDITTLVHWSSANQAIALINNKGLAYGVAQGVTTITASLNSVTSNPAAALTVTAAVLTSITVTPADSSIRVNGTQQFTATGNYSDQTTVDITSSVVWGSSKPSVATIISNSGLATGVSLGSTTISAAYNGINGQTTLQVKVITYPNWAYVYSNANNNNQSYSCGIPADGTLQSCISTGVSFVGGFAGGIATNPAATFLYVTSNNLNGVTYCSISEGNIGTCNLFLDQRFDMPWGIAINPAGTIAYIVDVLPGAVSVCHINVDGSLTGTCSQQQTFPIVLSAPKGIAVNAANTFVYVTGQDGVYNCPINPGGTLGTCVDNSVDSNGPVAVAVFGEHVYLADPYPANTITSCHIKSDGSVENCGVATTFAGPPTSIAIDSSGKYAYVVYQENYVAQCTVNGATLDNCTNTGSGFFAPYAIAVT
jgi:uncharacterized protein YjdB